MAGGWLFLALLFLPCTNILTNGVASTSSSSSSISSTSPTTTSTVAPAGPGGPGGPGGPTTTTSTTEPGGPIASSSASSTTTRPGQAMTTTAACETVADGFCELSANQTAMRCDAGLLTGSKLKIVKILCYIATVWIIIWCIATIAINAFHRNKGHHRFLQLYEEIFIILLFICIGGLNLTFRSKEMPCKIVSILSHLFMMILAGAFLMEAIFAHAMVHNKKSKNGTVPPIANYIIPIVIALIPTLATYFTQKKYYGDTGIHCFAVVPSDAFWGFVIPVWLMLLFAGLMGSLGCLACNMTTVLQDQDQIHWAKKSSKSVMFFSYFLLLIWLTNMMASSQQRMWIFILFFVESLIFGPMIFVYHTFGHRMSSIRMRTTCIGSFYKPCEDPIDAPLPRPIVPLLDDDDEPVKPLSRVDDDM